MLFNGGSLPASLVQLGETLVSNLKSREPANSRMLSGAYQPTSKHTTFAVECILQLEAKCCSCSVGSLSGPKPFESLGRLQDVCISPPGGKADVAPAAAITAGKKQAIISGYQKGRTQSSVPFPGILRSALREDQVPAVGSKQATLAPRRGVRF